MNGMFDHFDIESEVPRSDASADQPSEHPTWANGPDLGGNNLRYTM